MHTPIPLFLSVGVGGIRSCPAYRQFWGVLWGLWAVFWLFVGKHMALHKFGSQSILRLYLVGVCFGVFWQSQRESASNCGGGLLARGRLPCLGSGFPCLGCCPAWLGFVLPGCVRVAPVALSAFPCRCRRSVRPAVGAFPVAVPG